VTEQRMIRHIARCRDCGRSCDKKNALAWAHNHARAFGHWVELQLGYAIVPEGWVRRAEAQLDLEEAIRMANGGAE
jgi:hypothetical protein